MNLIAIFQKLGFFLMVLSAKIIKIFQKCLLSIACEVNKGEIHCDVMQYSLLCNVIDLGVFYRRIPHPFCQQTGT